MANVTYEDTAFPGQGLLVRDSLYETLYRLEEARYGLRSHTAEQVRGALTWIASREVPGSQRLAFERTPYDREQTGGYRAPSGEKVRTRYLKLPTGEGKWNSAIGAVYPFLCWEDVAPELTERARASFLDVYPGPRREGRSPINGCFCCGFCNAGYQKALWLADPDLYAEQEPTFIARLRSERADSRRWKRHPFYYTILTLEEIGSAATREELHEVARHVRPSLLDRYQGDDRVSRFRRLALERALEYA